jgi:Ca2+-binding EF-hand superfamily protein
MKKAAILAILLGFVLSFGLAQEMSRARSEMPMSFSDLDQDGDGMVDMAQFSTAFSSGGFFANYDDDSDARLTGAQLSQALFDLFDEDSSGGLDQTEFSNLSSWVSRASTSSMTDTTGADTSSDTSSDTSTGDDTSGDTSTGDDTSGDTSMGDTSTTMVGSQLSDFNTLDADANGEISYSEFSQNFDLAMVHLVPDAEGNIGETDLNNLIFLSLDTDADQMLSESEFVGNERFFHTYQDSSN